MSGAETRTEPKVEIQARVFRIAWDRKPNIVPTKVWMWLGKKRVPFTGRWENLGTIARSEDGTARIVPKEEAPKAPARDPRITD